MMDMPCPICLLLKFIGHMIMLVMFSSKNVIGRYIVEIFVVLLSTCSISNVSLYWYSWWTMEFQRSSFRGWRRSAPSTISWKEKKVSRTQHQRSCWMNWWKRRRATSWRMWTGKMSLLSWTITSGHLKPQDSSKQAILMHTCISN